MRLLPGLVFLAVSAMAQQVISVQPGVVHHAEGRVLVEGQQLQLGFAKFPILPVGKTVVADKGRMEVLLTPGVFLRVAEKGSFRMVKSAISEATVEILDGSALVEVAELGKEHKVAVMMKGTETLLNKPGLILFNAAEQRVRVFEGKALVSRETEKLELGKGREYRVGGELAAAKFDSKQFDELYEWSEVRSQTMALANIRAASGLRQNGFKMSTATWAWFPGMGMLTYVPYRGMLRSPFGYYYYSPAGVWQAYAPRQSASSGWNNGGGGGGNWGGMNGGASRGSVMSSNGGTYSAPMNTSAPSAAPAAAPAATPAAGGGGGRGR